METGDRMLLYCSGGPAMCRLVNFPPPLEISVEGGMYILVDEGSPSEWHYQFISQTDLAL